MGLPLIAPPNARASEGDVPTAELIRRLEGKDGSMHRAAIRTLAVRGSDAKEAVPALVNILRDSESDSLSNEAGYALFRIGGTSIPALIRLLKETGGKGRLNAIKVLARFGPAAAEATPGLLMALESSNQELRINAVATIVAISTGAKPAIPRLIKALDDDDPIVVGRAAQALGEIGASSKDVEIALSKVLASNEWPRWFNAVRPIGKLKFKSAIPRMLELLSIDQPNGRMRLIEAFMEMGQPGQVCIPHLVRLYSDQVKVRDPKAVDQSMRIMLWQGIAHFRPPTEEQVLFFGRQLKGTEGRQAVEALARFGNGVQKALPSLVEVRNSGNEGFQWYVRRCLLNIGSAEAMAAVNTMTLKQPLNSPPPYDRRIF